LALEPATTHRGYASDPDRAPAHTGEDPLALLDALHALRATRCLHECAIDDTLVGIAHDADVPMLLRERADDPVLGAVGVLVLVDQDPLPEPAVPGQHLRHPVEEPDGEQEEVVEVHRPRGGEPLLVAAVHGRDLLRAGA